MAHFASASSLVRTTAEAPSWSAFFYLGQRERILTKKRIPCLCPSQETSFQYYQPSSLLLAHFASASSLMRTTAEAPSLSVDALPAVTVPPGTRRKVYRKTSIIKAPCLFSKVVLNFHLSTLHAHLSVTPCIVIVPKHVFCVTIIIHVTLSITHLRSTHVAYYPLP